MREIKFRAWDKSEEIMCHNANHLSPNWFWEHPNLVSMQYTGLKDKNGKESYHKDIARDMLTLSLFVIEWNEGKGKFQLMPVDLPKTFHYIREVECITDMEVIGNIYENPELLEVK